MNKLTSVLLLFFAGIVSFAQAAPPVPKNLEGALDARYLQQKVLAPDFSNTQVQKGRVYRLSSDFYGKGGCAWGDKESFLTFDGPDRTGGNVCTVRDVTLAWLTNREGVTFKGAIVPLKGKPTLILVYKNSF